MNAVELATNLTIAWLAIPNTRMSADDIPVFVRPRHNTVSTLASILPAIKERPEIPRAFVPAVSVPG